MSEQSNMTLRRMLVEVTNVINTTGLTVSPLLYTVTQTPKTKLDQVYTLNLVSRDTQKYRNGFENILRMEHELTVSVLKLIKPNDQFESQLDAFDLQEKIIVALSQAEAFSDARVDWISTTPHLSSNKEHIIMDMIFKIEMDWSWNR